MPNMYNKIYEDISLRDFNDKFIHIQNLDDKFDFICSYLLSFEFRNTMEPADFEVILTNARTKFVEASIHAKNENEFLNKEKLGLTVINPNTKDADIEKVKLQKEFIADPIKFFANHARELGKKIKTSSDTEKENWINHCDVMARNMESYRRAYYESSRSLKTYGLIKKVSKNLYNEDFNASEMLDRNKGGIFERLFNTTSVQFRNFKTALLDFENISSENFSNFDELERRTKEYLCHKIPSFKMNDSLPKKEDINRLSGTSRNRVELCVNVLKEIQRQKVNDEMVNAIKNEVTSSENNPQKDFQDVLCTDLDSSKNKSADNIMELNDSNELVSNEINKK